jgi:hypothetical protein
MQAENVEEYKGIRTELLSLKNCITTYVGFVVGGAATAFWGLAGKVGETGDQRLAMAFASTLLAISITLVLRLLSYKFRSHNRYAGYSKLLAHERYLQGDRNPEHLLCWEICVDRQRDSDLHPKRLLDYCGEPTNAVPPIGNLRASLENYCGPTRTADQGAWTKGLRLMIFSGPEQSGSWQFPLYVARVFAALDLVFIGFAVFFLTTSKAGALAWTAFVVLFAFFMVMWVVFGRDLARLMLGSETVDAYCWKFVPIRAEFLRSLNPSVQYRLIGVATMPT